MSVMNIRQYIHEQVPDVLSNIHQTSQACIYLIKYILKETEDLCSYNKSIVVDIAFLMQLH